MVHSRIPIWKEERRIGCSGNFLCEIGFIPSRADQDLWIHKSEEYNVYDYIATNVDDLIIVSKNPLKYMNYIEQHFQVRDVTDSPK
eukprot:13136460-Ditylum_brightwellii.AAC.1